MKTLSWNESRTIVYRHANGNGGEHHSTDVGYGINEAQGV